jgi:hypothetical protein
VRKVSVSSAIGAGPMPAVACGAVGFGVTPGDGQLWPVIARVVEHPCGDADEQTRRRGGRRPRRDAQPDGFADLLRRQTARERNDARRVPEVLDAAHDREALRVLAV